MSKPPDLRWYAWCDAFLAAKRQPLDQEQSEWMVKMVLIELQTGAKEHQKVQEGIDKHPLGKVWNAHAQRIGLVTTPHVPLLFSVLYPHPATLVMYAHAFRRSQMLQKPHHKIDLGRVNMHIFPDGHVTPDELERLWDMQKDKHSPNQNYLDGVQP